MTDMEIGERKAARDILSFIETVCFSQEYLQFRVNHGSNGQRNLIMQMIKEKYSV